MNTIKRLPLITTLAILLAVPSCSLLNNQSSYQTFQDTWDVALAAYDAHCERVVQGKVDPAKVIIADTAWNQFRTTFRAAFIAASKNWSAPPPPDVQLESTKLITALE